MNVEELFKKAENGTLTYDQFKALAETNKVKFADLSEGMYVSKGKFDDEISARDTRINTLNDTLTARDNDLANLKKQLEDAGQDATKLADLTTQFNTLQSKYDEDVKKYQAQIAKQSYEFAVKDVAGSQKFTSNAAKRDFINTLIGKNLAMEGEKITGVDDFIKQYAADNADAFVKDDNPTPPPAPQPKLPQFAGPTPNPQPDGGKPTSQFGFNFRGVR